jgi:hypothetical protein
MKKSLVITGLLLMLLVIGNGCHRIRRDIRERARTHMERHFRGVDSKSMHWMGRGRGPMQMNGMRRGMGPGQMQMNGMRRGMGPGQMQMNGMRRGMGPGQMQMNGMGRGMGPMQMNRMGRRPMGPGRQGIESIPNLTEKQRKDIADLRQKQMADMNKLRDETATKMKSLREASRTKILNLLTDEQKKFVEANAGVPQNK